jgi:hypothetical protein
VSGVKMIKMKKLPLLFGFLFCVLTLATIATIPIQRQTVSYSNLLANETIGYQDYFSIRADSDNITELSVYDDSWGTFLSNVYVNGSHAFVGANNGGLVVIDISDLNNPTPVDYYSGEYSAREIVVENEFIYSANAFDGVKIFNGSNPNNISLLTTISTGHCNDLTVDGNILYAASDPIDIYIYDITDKASPVNLGEYNNDTTRSSAIFMNNSYAFLAQGIHGVHILDVSVPSSITEVGYFNYGGAYRDIIVDGQYVYALSTNRLEIIDLTDINNPILTDSYSISFSTDIEKDGNRLFNSGSLSSGAKLLDVSNVNDIQLLSNINTPTTSGGNFLSGDLAFVTDVNMGLFINNITNIETSGSYSPISTCFLGGETTHTFIKDDLLFVANGYAGLEILNICYE